ncbi:MAG TPA: histidine kinase dimerization/phospho-acceptor domain-containing protein, partial [Gaiellales bacterium]|nr:histidine kinase dimerization/phospho-acceptor domain-containing protein [Gaiellales bacterium]
ITKPLKVVGEAADRVARGDLEVNVVTPRTPDDELGTLAKRFQGMVDRLRELDELERNFLMRVTHELRTPITAISGHVQAVTEGVVDPEDLDASLAAVSEEVRRIGRLVDDLLDLTRLEAHQFRLLREVDELERNFLMRVTHELRTPVTAISGHVQAMNEGLVGPEDMDTSLDAVSEEVRRIGRLVDDLLDLTRLEAHQFRLVREEVGLEALLEQAAASFRDRARANEVSFDTPIAGAPTILSDGDRVLQIVSNLLDNAFRWTPRKGTVTLSYATANSTAAIHISDTGPGIPAADQDAVFHPFYSRRGEGGTGLGLSIGRELAHALGGRLTVDSEVGQGTTFTLSLPSTQLNGGGVR